MRQVANRRCANMAKIRLLATQRCKTLAASCRARGMSSLGCHVGIAHWALSHGEMAAHDGQYEKRLLERFSCRPSVFHHYGVGWAFLKCCPCHAKTRPGAQNAAPATTSATPSPKCCACHANQGPPAARATTSNPIIEFSNAAPATQRHAQVHKVPRLPRFQQRHLQSAAPVTQIRGPQPRARQHPIPL